MSFHNDLHFFWKRLKQSCLKLRNRMLEDFELITKESTENVESFLSNPVNTFLLTKKLTKDFKLFKSINNSTEIEGSSFFQF